MENNTKHYEDTIIKMMFNLRLQNIPNRAVIITKLLDALSIMNPERAETARIMEVVEESETRKKNAPNPWGKNAEN